MRVLTRHTSIGDDKKILVRKDGYYSREEHRHDFLELVYIASGSALHHINGYPCNARKGDLYLLDFCDVHDFTDKSSDFMIITCAFTPDAVDDSLVNSHNARDVLQFLLFQPFFEQTQRFCLHLNVRSDKEGISRLLEEMTTEYMQHRRGCEAILRGDLLVLLSKIFRLAIEQNENTAQKHRREIVNSALDYLKTNYSHSLSVDDVARNVLLSPSYFSSVFKEHTGLSITDYIQRLRIEKACEMLEKTNYTVGEIMGMVGYNDSKSFYKVFKRCVKLTPGEYKRLHKKK